MTKSRHINKPREVWTPEQIALLREHYPHKRTADLVPVLGKKMDAIYHKVAALGIKKYPEYLASPDACRLRRGDNVGAAYRFTKGQPAWNKGMKGLDLAGERGKATQFKKGQKSHTWRPVGSERITHEGILERKMSDTGCTRRDYVPVHVMLWEKTNGPVPEGHLVVFRDGDRQNITLDNLLCLSRADNMRRNSYHNRYPKEVGLLIQLRGAVNRKINQRKKDEQPTIE